MKLKNKKTGEIIDLSKGSIKETCFGTKIQLQATDRYNKPIYIYNSLAELNADWEDVPEEPKEDGLDNIIALVEAYSNNDSERYPKEIVEKLRARKRLKDKGFKFKRWQFLDDRSGIWVQGNLVPDIVDELDILFGGEE